MILDYIDSRIGPRSSLQRRVWTLTVEEANVNARVANLVRELPADCRVRVSGLLKIAATPVSAFSQGPHWPMVRT